MNKILPLLIGLLLSVSSAQACLWDTDTLAAEAKGLPKLPHILTGWFERNPDQFYQMRLERTIGEIRGEPDQLELYDDAAVAADRLGKSAEALRLIGLKQKLLSEKDPEQQKFKDHWYRYYANKGTFLAHQWILEGPNAENLELLEQSRSLVRKAIDINPEAHFGREKYQLVFIEWLLANLKSEDPVYITIPESEYEEAIKGFSGLIALGAAWESLDVVHIIEGLSIKLGHSTIAVVARRRSEELIASGKKPFFSDRAPLDNFNQVVTAAIDPELKPKIEDWYDQSRREADEWHKKRLDFIESRLKLGHPDKDKLFWRDFEEVEPTVLYGDDLFAAVYDASESSGVIFVFLALLGLTAVARLIVLLIRQVASKSQ